MARDREPLALDTIGLVALGGALGAGGRWLATGWLQADSTPAALAVLAVNGVGCLLMGALIGMAVRRRLSARWSAFLGAGALGGFTTFSTFALDVHGLAAGYAAAPRIAGFAYLVATPAVCLLACQVGMRITRPTRLPDGSGRGA